MALTRIGGANAITGTIPQGNIANASLGAVTALPAGVGGKANQTVYVSQGSTQAVATTSFTDLTGVTLNITPISTDSKILITCELNNLFGTGEGSGIQIVRTIGGTSTNVYTGSQTYTNYFGGITDVESRYSTTYLDSPSTTSQVTYKIQVRTDNGNSVTFNRGDKTNLIATEII